MKKFKYFSFVLLFMALCIPMVSCSDGDDDEPSKGKITVVNNSNYDLPRFTIHFINDGYEEISSRDFGTLYQGDSQSMDIPAGAERYYFGTYMYGNWYFSVYYKTSITKVELDAATVGRWTTN